MIPVWLLIAWIAVCETVGLVLRVRAELRRRRAVRSIILDWVAVPYAAALLQLRMAGVAKRQKPKPIKGETA
jgi:hypothetical protein